MNKGLIGIQLMMLKDKIAQSGAYDAFAKLAELGYHSVEISQIPMTAENVAAMRKASQDFDITICAASASLEPMRPGAPGETLQNDFDKIVADCKTLDCNYLRVGMLPFGYMGSREKALDFVKRMDEAAEKLGEHGIKFYYHNHHVEFVKYDGEYLLDIIRKNTKHIGFELDVHWIQRGGENPVTYMQQYKGRLALLHLKDYRIGEMVMPEGPMDFGKFQQAFLGTVQYAEVGEGSLPMKDIIETGLACGSEHFIIEQDAFYGRDPYDSLAISRDNLIALGYKDWFAR